MPYIEEGLLAPFSGKGESLAAEGQFKFCGIEFVFNDWRPEIVRIDLAGEANEELRNHLMADDDAELKDLQEAAVLFNQDQPCLLFVHSLEQYSQVRDKQHMVSIFAVENGPPVKILPDIEEGLSLETKKEEEEHDLFPFGILYYSDPEQGCFGLKQVEITFLEGVYYLEDRKIF